MNLFANAVGDSGYALRPWMITPIRDPPEGTAEADFNDCQMSARNTIERVNGVWKMRFRCLLKHRVLHYSPQTASKIINTCCALHNLCIENNLPEVMHEEENDDLLDGIFNDNFVPNQQNDNCPENILLQQGKELQNRIVRQYFTTT